LLLEAHMELRAARERQVPVKGADGIRRRTLRASSRPLMTLVGEVSVSRLAYQARDVNGLHPMDSVLNLSPEAYSHGVERFVAEHAAIQSFDDVQREVVSHTGAQVAKRQVEEMSVRAAADFELFYAERRESGELEEHTRDPLVMTFDGKGIVMVPRDLRPATKKAAGKAVRKLATRLTSGEKRNRKRMAEVAAIYTVPSYARTAEEVVADLNRCADREARPARPKVRNKRVWASVAEPAKAIIEETFREALARDPEHQRQWVALLDGNEDQLALVKAAAKKYGPVFIVVDLMHVLEYLWRAGHGLYGDKGAFWSFCVGSQRRLLRPTCAERFGVKRCTNACDLPSSVPPSTFGNTRRTCTTPKRSPGDSPSRRASSKEPAATSSKTAWSAAALAGHLPEPRPSSACARSVPAATSMPIGKSTYERNSDAITPFTMRTPRFPIRCKPFDASNER